MVDGILSLPRGSGFSSKASDTLTLRPGQILPGIVLEVNPENAVILLNRINVVAELATTVLPGEKLMLQVVKQQPDGKFLLQKVSPSQGGNEQTIVPSDIETILDHFGLKNSKLNENIVKELLQLKAPVTQRTVELLSAFALNNKISPKEVPGLVWLWARGLPITRDSILAMVSLMEGGVWDGKMGDLLQFLIQTPSGNEQAANTSNVPVTVPGGKGLQVALIDRATGTLAKDASTRGEAAASGEAAAGAPKGSPAETNGNTAVTKALEQLLLVPEETTAQWTQKLGDALVTLGLSHERDVLKLLEQMRRDPEGIKTPKEFAGIKDTGDLAVLLKGDEGKTLRGALMEMLKPGENLLGESFRATSQVVRGILKDITGFQLLNIAGQQEGDGIATFIPGWMVLRGAEVQPFFLKVKKYLGSDNSCPEDYRCQVLFFISTKGLGEVMCRLALENHCVTCGFTLQGEEECRLVDSMLPVLQERLESLPWKTVIYPSKVSEPDELQQTWYQETFVTHNKSFRSLDARV